MSNEKVSVIVPIYKVEKYLDRCVQSIRNQTYRNLEIILVDDGSPDNCPQMCDTYAKQDDRIRVIHKENGGLSDARNAGIDIATGVYISFVDSDDWIHNQMIEILMGMIEQKQCEISVCQSQYAYEGKEYKDSLYESENIVEQARMITRKESQYDYFDKSDWRNAYIVAWNKLYHRRLFDKIRYPKGKVHEDEFTTFKLLYEADGIAWTDTVLYYYFVREDSIMGEFKESRFDIFDAYLEKIRCYQQWNEDELAIKMLFHAIHMLAQYQKWMDEAGADLKETLYGYRDKLLKSLDACKKLSRPQRLEYFLFSLSFSMYYKMWKIKTER